MIGGFYCCGVLQLRTSKQYFISEMFDLNLFLCLDEELLGWYLFKQL